MPRKKKILIHCLIFPKGKFKKKDILCFRKTDFNIKKKQIRKVDGDFIVYLRPKCKFKKVEKKYRYGIKIFEGFLK